MEEPIVSEHPWSTDLFAHLVADAPTQVLWEFEIRGMMPCPDPIWGPGGEKNWDVPLNSREIEVWLEERRVRRQAQWPWEWASRVMQEGKTYFRDDDVDVVFKKD